MKVPTLRILFLSSSLLCLLVLGCSETNPTTPAPADAQTGLVGIWQGTLGDIQLRLEISENENRSLVGFAILGQGSDTLTLKILETVWTSPTNFTLFLACEAGCLRTLRGSLIQEALMGSYSEIDSGTTTRTAAWQVSRLEPIIGL